jgi:hypothetical protein
MRIYISTLNELQEDEEYLCFKYEMHIGDTKIHKLIKPSPGVVKKVGRDLKFHYFGSNGRLLKGLFLSNDLQGRANVFSTLESCQEDYDMCKNNHIAIAQRNINKQIDIINQL